MSNKRKLNIWPLWALMGVSVLICLMSCSSLREFVGWNTRSDSTETRNPFSDDEIGSFLARVQPHQGDLDSYYGMGCYLQERGRHKLAIREFEKVIVLDPHHVRAYNQMAVSYDFLGDFPRAVENYEKALKVNPDLDYVHNNLGYSYLLQGNPDSAIAAFQRAIALDDEKKRYHNNLAMAYGEKGQFDLAFEEFRRAGDEWSAYHNVAQLLYRRDQYREAAPNLGKALAGFPKEDTGEKPATEGGLIQAEREGKTEYVVSASPIISIDRGKKSDMQKEGEIPRSIALEARDNRVEQTEDAFQTVVFVPMSKSDTLVNSEVKTDQKEVPTPPETGIEVLNGNGVNRMAAMVGDYLRERGFLVLSPKNADHFNHTETRIHYCIGYLQDAYQVAKLIPGYQNMDKAEQFEDSNAKVKVVIGRDMIPFKQVFRRSIADRGRLSPVS
jgi:tetratricopeptide (TPR) repeat protein